MDAPFSSAPIRNNAWKHRYLISKKKNPQKLGWIKRLMILIFTSIYIYNYYLLGLMRFSNMTGKLLFLLIKILSYFMNAFKSSEIGLIRAYILASHFVRASFRLFHSWTARFLKGRDEKCRAMYGPSSSPNPSSIATVRQRWSQNHALIFSKFPLITPLIKKFQVSLSFLNLSLFTNKFRIRIPTRRDWPQLNITDTHRRNKTRDYSNIA